MIGQWWFDEAIVVGVKYTLGKLSAMDSHVTGGGKYRAQIDIVQIAVAVRSIWC